MKECPFRMTMPNPEQRGCIAHKCHAYNVEDATPSFPGMNMTRTYRYYCLLIGRENSIKTTMGEELERG